MGSEQLQVGSQGGSGRAVDVDLLVDTLKKVLDKAEVRREGRENGVALEKLISIVQAESRALRSLTRQQLKKGIEAFNKKFGDAVMADDTVLYIL